MYIERVPNRKSPPAILLRRSWREGDKTYKQTLANLSDWADHKIEALHRLLQGETLVRPSDIFFIERSLPHGHVEAVLAAARKLDLPSLLASRPCRERDLVLAMIVARLIHPSSKLATTRSWHDTTLAEELNVSDADVDELYEVLDWLLARKERIEAKLAARHLKDGALVLYDTSTSYYYGRCCPLARYGHDRDKKGLPVIVYGVLTDGEGRPVAVDVYPGNTGDPKTVPDQVDKLLERFGLSRVVLVGDRGMLTQTQIDTIRQRPELGWVSSLRSSSIQKLVQAGQLQPSSLFDEKNLAEIHSPSYPGERLVVCFNPVLAQQRKRTRQELLAMTEKALERIAKEVGRRKHKPLQKAEIGVKAGRLLHRFKMGKHFVLRIDDAVFGWSRRPESIEREAGVDGIYVIRTSEPEKRLSAEDAVRTYKSLSQVERAFRCLKGVDLLVRPIFHRTEEHVRAHIFFCLLAYYVEWHLRKAWAPLLFEDEHLATERKRRDPVAPPEPSPAVKQKKATRQTPEGLPVHSFRTLISALATRCKNLCRVKNDPKGPTLTQLTELTTLQARALELIENL